MRGYLQTLKVQTQYCVHSSSPCTFLVDLKVTVVMDHAAVSQPIVFLYKLFLPLVSAPCANYHIYNE